MATTIQAEVLGVRSMLNNPLPQAPSYNDILEEMQAEYQNITNLTNATANSWQVANYTLTSVAGQYEYTITPANDDFFKALNVTTVPPDVDTDPQYMVEFTELEHIPKEWGWLGENQGQFLMSSHDSQLIAFYRTITSSGSAIKCQIRPTPTRVQDYNILYQVTDWWPQVLVSLGKEFTLPHSSQRFYIRALVAQNLLLKGNVSWSFDADRDAATAKLVESGLSARLARYQEGFNEYRGSLDNPDITFITSWADDNVWQ